MTNIIKANWLTNDDNMHFSMPITKVDKEKRIVSGFATLDNIDKQGDIVPLDVSVKAFEKFRGNIREMHQPKAVGKIISFKSDKYFNKEDNKFYNGVYVSAYISKGAQDTWEKVIDGTLSGFSIGGNINNSEDMYDQKIDKSVRVIKDYDLTELSLVDNPANQFANILSIQKKSGVDILDSVEMLKMELENVLWCSKDDLVTLNSSDSSSCPVCEKNMQNIGFIETNDSEKAEMIKSLLSKFSKSSVNDDGIDTENNVSEYENTVVDDQAKSIAENIAKEEYIVADENVESVEEVVEVDASENDDSVEENVEEVIEKSEEAAAPVVESEELDLAKAVDDLRTSIAESASANTQQIDEIASLVKSLAETFGSIDSKVKSIEEGLDNFGKRVDAVEADTAVRKSGDLGGVVQLETKIQKSVWGGRFLNSADLYR